MNLFGIYVRILSCESHPHRTANRVGALNWCAAFFWNLSYYETQSGEIRSYITWDVFAEPWTDCIFLFKRQKLSFECSYVHMPIETCLMVSSIKMSLKFIDSSQRISHQLNNICKKNRRIESGGVCASLHISRKATPTATRKLNQYQNRVAFFMVASYRFEYKTCINWPIGQVNSILVFRPTLRIHCIYWHCYMSLMQTVPYSSYLVHLLRRRHCDSTNQPHGPASNENACHIVM